MNDLKLKRTNLAPNVFGAKLFTPSFGSFVFLKISLGQFEIFFTHFGIKFETNIILIENTFFFWVYIYNLSNKKVCMCVLTYILVSQLTPTNKNSYLRP